jgi:transposase
VGQTLQHALNEIARREPEWLRHQVPSDWRERYAKKLDDYRLNKGETARRDLAEVIGRDGLRLLQMVNQTDAPAELAHLEAIRILEQVWREQYSYDGPDDPAPGWRDKKTLPPASDRIASPVWSKNYIYEKKAQRLSMSTGQAYAFVFPSVGLDLAHRAA